ncbi:MAG: histidine kinase [Sporolactobacillus sp.]|nr:histidine kinase [Sporolactobacillus sp.]
MKRFLVFFAFFLFLTLTLFYVLNSIGTKLVEDSLITVTKEQNSYADNILQNTFQEIRQYAAQYVISDQVHSYQDQKKNRDAYENQIAKMAIQGQMLDRIIFNQAVSSIDIYWKNDNDVISTLPFDFNEQIYRRVTRQGWAYRNGELYYFAVYPLQYHDSSPANIQYVVGIKMNQAYLQELLNKAMSNRHTTAFLLIDRRHLIGNRLPVDRQIVNDVKRRLSSAGDTAGWFYHDEKGDNYVLGSYIAPLHGYFVTYTESSALLSPLKSIRFVFVGGIALILLIGLTIIFVYYHNFFRRVQLLIAKFKQAESGNYRLYINNIPNNEFKDVFNGFNHMMEKTRKLIQSLKTETDLRRETERRQLQSQISPHFLYNNLFFIMSMAKVSPDAVIQMSRHMAEYCRYLTKQKSHDVTLGMELELAEHYLSIISLRKKIQFSISIPPELQDCLCMPLLIQPIIENAVQHGIEERQGAHRIAIVVRKVGEGHRSLIRISVSDDGKGLTQEQRERLRLRIRRRQPPTGGVGLWNVGHRLRNRYGADDPLRFLPNRWGGLTVSFDLELGGTAIGTLTD